MLTRWDATIATLEARVASGQQGADEYRQRLAKVIQRAVTRQRSIHTQKVLKT
jgi:hypothetical protein